MSEEEKRPNSAEIPERIQRDPVDDNHPIVRDFMFRVNETKGEALYDMYIGDWLLDEGEGDDKETRTELRYGLCGRIFKDLRVHYILFCQVKSEKKIIMLGEDICPLGMYKIIWGDFLRQHEEQFGSPYEHRHWEFSKMENERRENLFNSMITLEL